MWAALGDVSHFCDPFCGSLAVLLRRPHPCNRTYFSETANDADGFLVNAWRSIQWAPEETAEWASWPVCEADLHARHLWLLRWRAERNLELLMGDPEWHDPRAAGYWLWGVSSWIGSGWCSGRGPWIVGADGRIVKRSGTGNGVWQQRPHLGDNGEGVNRPQAREPGVNLNRPFLSMPGQGVNQGLLHEPGGGEEPEFHPMTMPELRRWFRFLSARLRHVRILNGDWTRLCTDGALKTLSVRQGDGKVGIFLDPPYRVTGTRAADLYTHDGGDELAAAVRAWCLKNGPDPQKRIVLAGFAGEGHEELENHGWRCVEWYTAGFLRGGMANQSENGTQQHQERLWLSPFCLRDEAPQGALCFGNDDA